MTTATLDSTSTTASPTPVPAPAPERLTLRKLVERLGPEFMDAELTVQMKDGHRNSEFAYLPTDLSLMPRFEANPSNGVPGRITFMVFTSTMRFVKEAAPRPSTPVASTPPPRAKAVKPPTAAQKRWLAAINTGEVFRWGHSWVASLNNPKQRGGAPGRSTYVVTCDLHDAGWIDSVRMEGSDRDYRIFLTEAGKLALSGTASA